MKKISETEFETKKAMEIVKNFSFPRLVGSEGGEKAVKMAKELFNQIDLPLKEEEFMATKFWISTVSQFGTFFAILITGLMIILDIIAPAWNLLLICGILGIAMVAVRLMSGRGGELKVLGTPIKTVNLVGKISAKKSNKAKIILMGHHDTKSQKLTTIQRGACFTFGGVGLIIAILAFTANAIQGLIEQPNTIIQIIAYIGSGLLIICAIPLSLNFLENRSVGALDNASSIASLYGLAKYFKANPLENSEIWILITGAEEMGMMGAHAFLKTHKEELDPKTTFGINFDMVGRVGNVVEYIANCGFPFARPTSKNLNSLAESIAKDHNYPIQGFYLPIGAATDAGVFRNEQIQTMDFINKSASHETHSIKDVPEKYDAELGKQFTIIGAEMALFLDQQNLE